MKKYLTIQNIIIVIFLGLMIGIINYSYSEINKIEKDKIEAINVIKALTDSTTFYKNKYDETVAEKKTIQIDFNKLTDKNYDLTQNQKELRSRISNLNNEKEVISAALIEANMLIEKLRGDGIVTIDSTKKTINFNDTTMLDFKYDITIENVKPSLYNVKPIIVFNSLNLPNKQTISFQWDSKDKRNGKPVSFSVSNTNPYYKIYNVDSYIIPEINHDIIKPNFWGKTKNFLKKSGSTIGKIGIGVGIGIAIMVI